MVGASRDEPAGGCRSRLRGDAEVPVEIGRGRGGAEALHADESVFLTQKAVPAVANGGLNSNARSNAKHGAPIIALLPLEELETGK